MTQSSIPILSICLIAPRAASSASILEKGEGYDRRTKFGQAFRNDPCLCGSGLKFKTCHGKQKGRVPRVEWEKKVSSDEE